MTKQPRFDLAAQGDKDSDLVGVGALWDQGSNKAPYSGVLRIDKLKEAIDQSPEDREQIRVVLFDNSEGGSSD